MDTSRGRVVSFLCLTFLCTCNGIPTSKTSPMFPGISKMSSKSHPMLASVFGTMEQVKALDKTKQNGNGISSLSQLEMDLNAPTGPNGPETQPPITFIDIESSLLCKLCREKNDLMCIQRHCWNDGSSAMLSSQIPATGERIKSTDIISGSKEIPSQTSMTIALPQQHDSLAIHPTELNNLIIDAQSQNQILTSQKSNPNMKPSSSFHDLGTTKDIQSQGVGGKNSPLTTDLSTQSRIDIPKQVEHSLVQANTDKIIKSPILSSNQLVVPQNVVNLEFLLQNLMQKKDSGLELKSSVTSPIVNGSPMIPDFTSDTDFGVNNMVVDQPVVEQGQLKKKSSIPPGLPKTFGEFLALGQLNGHAVQGQPSIVAKTTNQASSGLLQPDISTKIQSNPPVSGSVHQGEMPQFMPSGPEAGPAGGSFDFLDFFPPEVVSGITGVISDQNNIPTGQDIRIQTMGNPSQSHVHPVVSAGEPEIFVRNQQNQFADGINPEIGMSTTPVPTTLMTMSPRRRAELREFSKSLIPFGK